MSRQNSQFIFKIILVLSIILPISLYAQNTNDVNLAIGFFKKGDSLLYYKDFNGSIENFEKALERYTVNDDWTHIAMTHNKLSECYINIYNLPKTLFHAEQALKVVEEKVNTGDNPRQKARALDNMGTYYMKGKSDLDLSMEYYEKAFQLRSENLNSEDQDLARSHYNFGTVKTYKGLYAEAVDHFNKAIEISKKKENEDPIEIAEIYRQIGNVLFEQGLYDETLEYLEKALILANKVYKPDNFYFVDLYNNIGLMYSNKKEENRSLEYYIKSLHLSEQHLGVGHPDQVRMHYNIADIYYKQKDDKKGLFHVDKTIEIGERTFGKDFPNLALPYSLKGLIVRGEQGVVYINKAVDLSIKAYGENNVRISYFYYYLSELYQEIGNQEKAIEYANKSLNIRKDLFGENNFYVVESYIHLAILEISRKDFSEALKKLNKSIEINKKATGKNTVLNEFDNYISPTQLLTSLERKAFVLRNIYEQSKNPEVLQESISTYQKAGELVEVIRQGQFNKEDKITFAKDAKNVFYGNISSLLLVNNSKRDIDVISTAFAYAEKSKANLLKEILNNSNAKEYSGLPGNLLSLEYELKHELSEVKSSFYQNIQEKNDSTNDLSNIKSKIADISRRQDSLEGIFEKQFPKYYQLKYADQSLSIKEIQNKLDENTTLLEYFMKDNILYAFVITKHNTLLEELYIEEIDKKIEVFMSSIELKNISLFKTTGFELYKTLLEPVKKHMIGDHLIVIPDESLWYLNFDLLLTSSVETNDAGELPYLLKEYAVSYANSADLLFNAFDKEMNPVSDIRKECLAFSFSNVDSLSKTTVLDFDVLRSSDDDLPGTRKEIKSIAAIVKGRYFYGTQAIEENFKNNISAYNVLHLALHGEVDHNNPENSRIYFNKIKGTKEDNILYSHELYALNIPAELTVLSACNTGVGKIANGEGVLSMGTAFQYAGTQSLLLTSWEVSDQTTPEVMKNFYKNLDEGMGKAKALQQAKLQFIKTADVFTRDPFYWGGFYLVGDYSSIEFEKTISFDWWPYFGIALILIVLFLLIRKRLIG